MDDGERRLSALEARIAALEATAQLSAHVLQALEVAARTQSDAIQRSIGEVEALRRSSEKPHPVGIALTDLLRATGQNGYAQIILALLFAIFVLSFLTIPAGSPLFPLFAIAERYVERKDP